MTFKYPAAARGHFTYSTDSIYPYRTVETQTRSRSLGVPPHDRGVRPKTHRGVCVEKRVLSLAFVVTQLCVCVWASGEVLSAEARVVAVAPARLWPLALGRRTLPQPHAARAAEVAQVGPEPLGERARKLVES